MEINSNRDSRNSGKTDHTDPSLSESLSLEVNSISLKLKISGLNPVCREKEGSRNKKYETCGFSIADSYKPLVVTVRRYERSAKQHVESLGFVRLRPPYAAQERLIQSNQMAFVMPHYPTGRCLVNSQRFSDGARLRASVLTIWRTALN